MADRVRSAALRVWLLTGTLGAAAAIVQWRLLPGARVPVSVGLHVPWWLLAVGFTAAELSVVHLHFGRNAHSFAVSEIPLVIGMFFCSPVQLVVARLVGCLVAKLVLRQAFTKLVFNLAQWWLATLAAIWLWCRMGAGLVPFGAGSMALVLGTVLLADVVSMLAITAVISAAEGRWQRGMSLQAWLVSGTTTVGTGCCGLVAVDALGQNWRGAWVLVGVAVPMTMAHRAYVQLRQRNQILETLAVFSRDVLSDLDLTKVATDVLQHVCALLNAEVGELVLDEGFAGAAVVLRRDATGVRPVAEPMGAPTARGRRHLARRVPLPVVTAELPGDNGRIGQLTVARRLGDVGGGFDRQHHQLLEALASHAAVALHNGLLGDRLQEQVRENAYQALHDPLTGLPNRVMFDRTVAGVVTSGPAAVLLLDLDRFKEVNDTLGHAAGDLLLREIGRRLSGSLPGAACIARLGGDEFAAVLPGAGPEEARDRAHSLLATLTAPLSLGDITFSVEASVGIACAPADGVDCGALLRRADVAMYAAKESRTGVERYVAARDQHSAARLALVAELRRALAEDELVLHWQPKLDLPTGRLVGAEALVRWRHPERGLIGPDDFVPVAEQTGLIMPLTDWVLRTALTQWRAWADAGVDLSVAVNVSPRVLQDTGFPARLTALITDADARCDRLTLEITENGIMANPDRAVDLLQNLRARGVHLSVDDLGMGHSSLGYLKQLPVDEVKIDKSFVLRMDEDPDDAAIVQAVVDLGHRLGMQVVAEGVETEAVWRRLRIAGCDVAQGFWISRPMEPAAFGAWVRDRTARPSLPVVA